MASQDAWAFDLATRGGVRLGALDVHSISLTFRLNGPSEARVRVLADAPGVELVEVHSAILRAYRHPPWAVGLSRTARFAGEVHGPLADSGDADGLEVAEFTAKDPWEAVRRRYAWTNLAFGPDTLDDAVAFVLSEAASTEESPAGPVGSYPHGLGVVTAAGAWPTVTRGWLKWTSIEEALRELWEAEQGVGFWWDVRPVYPPTATAWAAMHIRLASGAPRTARLEYGPGTLANVAEGRIERQGPINSVLATGKEGLTWQIDSESSAASYGLWPVQAGWGDVDTTARLDTLARGVWQPLPADVVHLSMAWPSPSSDGLSGLGLPAVPMLWDDFDLGDTVAIYLRGRRRELSAVARVREATVEVTPEGSERLSALVVEVV